jgi:hypothetical protein
VDDLAFALAAPSSLMPPSADGWGWPACLATNLAPRGDGGAPATSQRLPDQEKTVIRAQALRACRACARLVGRGLHNELLAPPPPSSRKNDAVPRVLFAAGGDEARRRALEGAASSEALPHAPGDMAPGGRSGSGAAALPVERKLGQGSCLAPVPEWGRTDG